MNNNDRTNLAKGAEAHFAAIITKISEVENQISDLPDWFEYLAPEQKNQLFHEFERLSQNLNTLSSWLSHPIAHRAKFKTSSNIKVLVSQEDGVITLKLLETNQNKG
jgi:hypothetical protein